MKNSPAYHAVLKRWIRSVIHQRRMLMDTGRSLANDREIIPICDLLEKQLEAFPYDSDRKMASFFISHSDEILEIIPGPGSGCHESRMNEYKAFATINLMLYGKHAQKQTV